MKTNNWNRVCAVLFVSVLFAGQFATAASGPDVSVSLTNGVTEVSPGGTYIYTLTITNNGNQTANSVYSSLTIPPITPFILSISDNGSANTPLAGGPTFVNWPPFSLASHSTVLRQITIKVGTLAAGTGKTATSTATVSQAGDTDSSNDSCAITNDLIVSPDLAVSITDGLTNINPGATMQYTITVSNIGNINLSGITVKASIPANTTVVPGSIGGSVQNSNSIQNGQIVWNLTDYKGGFGNNSPATLQFTLQLAASLPPGTPSTLAVVATASDDGTNGADINPANNSACDVDCVHGIPASNFDLGITITDGLTDINPGETMEYTLTVNNVGNVDANNVLVKATIPPNTTVVSGSISDGGYVQGNFVVWPLFMLATQNSVIRQFTLMLTNSLPTPAPTTLSVTGTVSGDAGEKNLANNSATDCDNIVLPPTMVDLAISQCNNLSGCAPAGQTVSYILTISNICTTPATGVTVVDTIPPGTDFVSASDGGLFNAANGTITWPPFSLNGGSSVFRSFIVRVQNPPPANITQLVNTATVSDDGTHGPDRCLCNNTTTLKNPICPLPDIAITKSVPVPCVTLGTNLTYTLLATTQNSVALTGVVVTDTLPANTTFVSASDGGTFANGVVTFPPFPLGGNSTAVRTITVAVAASVPAGVTTLVNVANVTDDKTHGPDSNPNNNTYTLTTPICSMNTQPDIAITKSVPVPCASLGATLTYTLLASTLNSTSVTGVVVTDTLPANTTFVSASNGGTAANGVVTFPPFALPGNSTAIRTVTVAVAASVPAGVTNIINVASVTDDKTHGPDLNPNNNTFTLMTPICSNNNQPDIAITKSVPVPCVSLGTNLTYTLLATTQNSVAVTGVVVTDMLPANTTFVSASDGGTFANGIVTFPPFPLAGNSTAVRTITVAVAPSVPAGVTNIVNVASVTDDKTHGPDSNPNNNTFTLTTPICTNNNQPDVAISKSVPVPCASLGANLTYTLLAATQNSVAVTGVVVTDTLPANTTFVSASDGGTFANGVVTFPAFPLAGNSTAVRTITVAVAASVPAGVTNIINVASVTDDKTHGPDSNPNNNTFTLTTPICMPQGPDIAIAINTSHVCANQVDTYTYALMVSDTTGQAHTGVVVTDTIPPNATFVSASDGGTLNPATGVVTFPAFDLPASSVVLRTVVVSVALPLVAPTVPISLTDSATVTDNGASGTDTNLSNNAATSTTQVSNLHFVSGPNGNPNPAVIGVPETFTAVAQDDANPNAPITYSWNFGDGSTGSGSTVMHTYTTAGPFTITLVVSNGIGCPLGASLNRDTAGNNNPAVTCKLFRAPFSLTKPNADSLTLVAQITLPSGFNPAGHTVTVDIANFSITAQLDKNGKGIGLPRNEAVQVRSNGALSIVTVKVAHANLRPLLAPNVPTSTKATTLQRQIFVIAFDLNGGTSDTFGGALNLNYLSNGKNGVISF